MTRSVSANDSCLSQTHDEAAQYFKDTYLDTFMNWHRFPFNTVGKKKEEMKAKNMKDR